ncbi:MAG: GNAT family N-acetyltransferase [Clostridiales bacterium]|jgi:ribosomal protein S18 acetylase RimI-like enzyme|nr:GNAT family N-acetyltransferase [Clostridiales bacterium]
MKQTDGTKTDFIPVTGRDAVRRLAALANEIWRECYAALLTPAHLDYMIATYQSEAAISDQLENQGYAYFFVAHGADEQAGYIGLMPDDDALFLSKIYLKARYRGTGLSQKAFDFIRDYAKRHGFSRIWLMVKQDNERAVAAYKKQGFVITEAKINRLTADFINDDYFMSLTIF